ncbi:MAG: hypothetical protein JW924_00650 [Fusobacteriaceae bacterium]|nr:hypothetical protein [Fusobacteriaceae bacterium]
MVNLNNREELEKYINERKSNFYIEYEKDKWEIYSNDDLYIGSIKIDFAGVNFSLSVYDDIEKHEFNRIYASLRGDILEIKRIFEKDKEVLSVKKFIDKYNTRKSILEFLVNEFECYFINPVNGEINEYRIKRYKLERKCKDEWEEIKIKDLHIHEINSYINSIMYVLKEIIVKT